MYNGKKLMLSQNLEKTLREAYQLATTYKHEYVTLEHLLFSLLEDQDAISVLKACAVDISNLRFRKSQRKFYRRAKINKWFSKSFTKSCYTRAIEWKRECYRS